jgi:hypothetical protein
MFYAKSTNGFYDSTINDYMPDDFVEITAENHAELINGQGQGFRIVADDSGHPILVSTPTIPVAAEGLCAQIDTAADAARQAVAGDPLRAVEYERSATEAQAFKAAGYPAAAVPRTVAAWAIGGRTAQQAADNILVESAAYTEALYQIRETRLGAKELVRQAMTAGDLDQAQDIAAETIAAIESAIAGIGNNA